MKQHVTALLIAAGTLAGSAWLTAQGPVKVELKNAQGQFVGTATLSPDQAGVKIALDLKGLPPGQHALHVHGTAKCEGPDFTSAGGHFNPEMKKHGLDNPEGAHAGDMANFTVAADGTAKATITNPRISLGAGANSVYTGGGTALMVHAMPDDMKTDPTGNAGGRI